MTRLQNPKAGRIRTALAAFALAVGLATAAPQQQPPPKRPAPAPKPAASAKKPLPARPAPPDASLVQAIRENTIGLALMERRDYTTALGHFQTACVLNPASDAGCLNMGIAFLSMRRFDDARQILSKSTERDPQNARAWYSLALLARATGDSTAARDDFQRAAAIDPDDPGTQYFLGYLATQDQKYDQAVAAFKRAVELDPLHISAEFGLSQAEQDSATPIRESGFGAIPALVSRKTWQARAIPLRRTGQILIRSRDDRAADSRAPASAHPLPGCFGHFGLAPIPRRRRSGTTAAFSRQQPPPFSQPGLRRAGCELRPRGLLGQRCLRLGF